MLVYDQKDNFPLYL